MDSVRSPVAGSVISAASICQNFFGVRRWACLLLFLRSVYPRAAWLAGRELLPHLHLGRLTRASAGGDHLRVPCIIGGKRCIANGVDYPNGRPDGLAEDLLLAGVPAVLSRA